MATATPTKHLVSVDEDELFEIKQHLERIEVFLESATRDVHDALDAYVKLMRDAKVVKAESDG